MDQINLPDEVLTQQICSNCGQYLSVGPVTVSPDEGGMLCGRCPKDPFAVNSLYNIIAERCVFKCVNHYDGCEQLLLLTEVEDHEKDCKYSVHECPFCKYKGNSCHLVSHFRKFHASHLMQGDTMEQIIVYKNFNISNFISNMSIKDLKLFANTASKLFMNCVNCGSQFKNNSTVYVCLKYHSACDKCSLKICPKCGVRCQWSKVSRLHNILLECEWENCSEKKNIFAYVSHKQLCKFRQYKCPREDCGYVSNLEGLKSHWHMSPLKTERNVDITSSIAYYWLIPDHNEFLYVTVEFGANNELTLAVSEINPVLPFNFELILEEYTTTIDAYYGHSTETVVASRLLEFYSAVKPVRYMKFVSRDSYKLCFKVSPNSP